MDSSDPKQARKSVLVKKVTKTTTTTEYIYVDVENSGDLEKIMDVNSAELDSIQSEESQSKKSKKKKQKQKSILSSVENRPNENRTRKKMSKIDIDKLLRENLPANVPVASVSDPEPEERRMRLAAINEVPIEEELLEEVPFQNETEKSSLMENTNHFEHSRSPAAYTSGPSSNHYVLERSNHSNEFAIESPPKLPLKKASKSRSLQKIAKKESAKKNRASKKSKASKEKKNFKSDAEDVKEKTQTDQHRLINHSERHNSFEISGINATTSHETVRMDQVENSNCISKCLNTISIYSPSRRENFAYNKATKQIIITKAKFEEIISEQNCSDLKLKITKPVYLKPNDRLIYVPPNSKEEDADPEEDILSTMEDPRGFMVLIRNE